MIEHTHAINTIVLLGRNLALEFCFLICNERFSLDHLKKKTLLETKFCSVDEVLGEANNLTLKLDVNHLINDAEK